MEQVAGLLTETLSPDGRIRKGAEAELTRRRDSPNERTQLHRCLFDVMCTPSVEASVRHAAAIFLQNLIRLQWSSESECQLGDDEKAILRTSVLQLLYSDDRKIRDALSCCISRIAEHDFPLKWPEVLPFLHAKLQERDGKVNGITFTAIISLLGVLESSTPSSPKAIPHLDRPDHLIESILAGLEQAAAAAELHTAIRGTELFGHLCRLNLVDDIKGTLPRWMKALHTFLQYPESEESSPLKKAVLEGLNIFLLKYSDEFTPYKEHFIPLVWKMLCEAHPETDDGLKIAGMEFLTSIAKSCFWDTFAQASTLQLLCEQIVIPNVLLRSDEVDLIREDFAEYIRVDIEGNNVDTRRRAACNLAVAAISGRLERIGKPVVSAVIRSLLQVAYSNIRAHWRQMDAAVCLILSLSVTNDSKSLNNVFIPDAFCDLGELYQNFVLPELEDSETSNLVLKADALKFICHFRFNLPHEVLIKILAHVRQWITHDNNVIAIYAAHCVDQIFMMDKIRDTLPDENVVLLTQAIVESLEGREPFEVDRLAKSLYHAVQVLRGECLDINARVMNLVCTQLQRATREGPLNSFYLHYLLDSLGFITSEQNFMDVHSRFFEIILLILQQNIDYLVPYALQIVSKCARVSQGRYEQPVLLLSPVLDPHFCRNKRYVSAVVLFVSTVFTCYPIEQTSVYIEPTLDFFEHLIFVKPLDHEGFSLISALIDALPQEMFVSTLQRALSIIFRRLDSAKTNKFVKNLILWLSRCVLVLQTRPEGPVCLIHCIENIQAGCFETLLRSVWLSSLERIVDRDDRELVVTAMTILLLTNENLLPNRALWKDSFTELCRLVQKNRTSSNVPRSNERASREIVAVGSRTLLSCAFQRPTLIRQDSADFFSGLCKAFSDSPSPTVNAVLNELSSPVKEFVNLMNK